MDNETSEGVAKILKSIRDGRELGEVDLDMSREHQSMVEALLEATLAAEPEADEKRLQELIEAFAEQKQNFESWLDGWLGTSDETAMKNVIHEAYLEFA